MAVSYAVMYHSLEALKKKLELDDGLPWHSFRIGSATRGAKLGVTRSVIKGLSCGGGTAWIYIVGKRKPESYSAESF